MSVRCLVDTNILIYSLNPLFGPKATTATSVLERVVELGSGVVHAQVVAEFISAATKDRATGRLLTPATAVAWIAEWMENTHWRDLTEETSHATLRAVQRYQMRVYDAQMWAVASVYSIPLLVTEDLQFQPTIEGVRYVNPFAGDFDLADLGL